MANNAAATKAVTAKAAANLAGPADFKMDKNRSNAAPQSGHSEHDAVSGYSAIFAC